MQTQIRRNYAPYRKAPYAGKYFTIRVDSKIPSDLFEVLEVYINSLSTDRKRVYSKHGQLNIAFTLVKPMTLNKLLSGLWQTRRHIQITPGRNACMDAFLDSIIEDLPFKPLRTERPNQMESLHHDIDVIDIDDNDE